VPQRVRQLVEQMLLRLVALEDVSDTSFSPSSAYLASILRLHATRMCLSGFLALYVTATLHDRK
jgi:hypothetical protein